MASLMPFEDASGDRSYMPDQDQDESSRYSAEGLLSDDYENLLAEVGLSAKNENQVTDKVVVAAEVTAKVTETVGSDAGSDNELSSLSTPPASDGDSCDSPDTSDMSDDDDFDLLYLAEKRNILKRYCDVLHSCEAYDASIAGNPISADPAPIWSEAKEVMAELFDAADDQQVVVAPNTNSLSTFSRGRAYKKPRIDISVVRLIDSKAYSNADENLYSHLGQANDPKVKSSVFCDSKWMIRSLQQLSELDQRSEILAAEESTADDISTTSTLTKEGWDVNINPLLGIVSFAQKAEKKLSVGTTMDEALMITGKAQLISQACPPFLVVHANKAFFAFSELTSQDVIGKPVEEIVQVYTKDVKDMISESTSKHVKEPGFANGMLGTKRCQVQVKPVANQSLSHVLVQIHEEGSLDLVVFNNTSITSNHANILVGCVG